MLIAIDSGHGMETAGKRTPAIPEAWFGKKKGDSIREKEFNKPTAEVLIKALERCGFETLNVSPGIEDISLEERYTKANNAKADAFISKHYNANKGQWGSANGIETIISQYANTSTQKLAEYVQQELVQTHKRTNRGVKTDIKQSGINLAVLRNAKMPAILTESGFMDNLAEAKTMLDPDFQKEDAEATCRGICKYFNVKYIEEIKPPAKTITPKSSKEDITWMQLQLNKVNKEYQIKVNGEYTPQTRNSLLIFATDVKGWDWEGNTGYAAGIATIQSLSKY